MIISATRTWMILNLGANPEQKRKNPRLAHQLRNEAGTIIDIPFELLLGITFSSYRYTNNDVLDFFTHDNEQVRLRHQQDCCETVWLEDVVGDIDDVIESPITMAQEITQSFTPANSGLKEPDDESYTWTFYKLGTVKGSVTLRWCGTSNGYYSEEVNCCLSGRCSITT